jgi:hypothetical protein
MKVFLSWSGARSKAMAEALRDWLPMVIQAVDPWMSPDIEKGRRWNNEIAKQLEESHVGIFCLTPEGRTAQWLMFEAGAISKHLEQTRVCTFLLDLTPGDLDGPITSFQHTVLQEDDVFKLLTTINRALVSTNERPIADKVLRGTFEVHWQALDKTIRAIPAPSGAPPPQRDPREMLEEILEILRGNKSIYGSGSTRQFNEPWSNRIVVTLSVDGNSIPESRELVVFWTPDSSSTPEMLYRRDSDFLSAFPYGDGGYTLSILEGPNAPIYEARVVISNRLIAKQKIRINTHSLTALVVLT